MLPILNQSFWRDEAFSALLGEKSPLQIIFLSAKDETPPLYILLLHYWMKLFGTTETAIRGLSFLFHLGTTAAAFLLTFKLTKSKTAALLVSLATLLNPFLLEYAFEARTYSLLAFLIVTTALCIAYRKYFIAGICLALALLSHNFALFSMVGIGLWWIVTKKQRVITEWKETLALFLLPAFAFLGWATVLWNQWVRVGHGFWIPPVTSTVLLQTFEKFATSDLTYPASGFLYIASVALVIIGLTYWMWKQTKETQPAVLLLAFLSCTPIVVVYAVSLLFAPVYLERYLIEVLPPAIIFIGFSIFSLLKENPAKKTVVIVFIAVYVLCLLQAGEQFLQMRSKASINWAVAQIESLAKPGDIIVPKDVLNFLETKWYVEQTGSKLPVYAYAPKGEVPFYIGSVLFEKKDIIRKLPSKKRIWQIEPDGGYKLLVTK